LPKVGVVTTCEGAQKGNFSFYKSQIFLLYIKKIMMDQSNWLLAKINFEPLRDTWQISNAN
jgi:hypothetical protein